MKDLLEGLMIFVILSVLLGMPSSAFYLCWNYVSEIYLINPVEFHQVYLIFLAGFWFASSLGWIMGKVNDV